jgi:hypothetical protein
MMNCKKCQCGASPLYRVVRTGRERIECPFCGNRTGAGSRRQALREEWNSAGWCGQAEVRGLGDACGDCRIPKCRFCWDCFQAGSNRRSVMDAQQAYEEAGKQKADMQVVGYGCMLFVALALGVVTWAVCAYCQHREYKAIAAYSICEMCGALLDATNVHARCAAEGVPYADVR